MCVDAIPYILLGQGLSWNSTFTSIPVADPGFPFSTKKGVSMKDFGRIVCDNIPSKGSFPLGDCDCNKTVQVFPLVDLI